MNFILKKIKFLLTLVFLCSLAQGSKTGKISGQVTFAEDNNLPAIGVNILLVGSNQGAATDQKGFFFINNVSPGTYSIKCEMIGSKTIIMENVIVKIGLTTTVDFELEEEAIEGEEVFVVAKRPLVVKDLTSTKSVITKEEMDQLPVETVEDILRLQSGVVKDASGNLHFRGGRSSEVSYIVDGIPIDDNFSGGTSLIPENNSIQQIEVLSGIFNAEYGRAMSGIVNIVTRDGSDQYQGSIFSYSGGYMASDPGLYLNLDKVDLNASQAMDFDLSGPVPFFRNIKFLITGRLVKSDGHLYGMKRFIPSDNAGYTGIEGETISQSGDSTFVPLSFSGNGNFMTKFTWAFNGNIKLAYSFTGFNSQNREYAHSYKYNPDGFYNNQRHGYKSTITYSHVWSPRTFHEFNFSSFGSSRRRFVHEDPWDEKYVSNQIYSPANSFNIGGNMLDQYYYNSNSTIFQGHFTSQITPEYEIKSGFELRQNFYDEDGFTLIFDNQNYMGRRYFDKNAISTFQNRFKPVEASSFVQTKMEFTSLVLNLGLRYDYFNSNANIPTDFKDPGNSYNPRPFNDAYNLAGVKTQLSPRFGLSYRITDEGFVRAAYGHFFQIPPYSQLYEGVDYRMTPGNLTTHIGNPDLDPERTVIYELGLQQQLSSSMAADLSIFSKDIRSLLGTKIEQTYIRSDVYSRFINRDYGNVRGVTLAINNISTKINLSFDYTYQVAKGNSSDPLSVLFDAIANRESEKKLVPLDWDQTHTINLSLGIATAKNINIGIIGSFGTGLPYTPSRPERKVELADRNSARRPFHHNIDLRSEKKFSYRKLNFRLFLKVENLFDVRNENVVWTDTGRAGYTLQKKYLGDLSEPVNTIDEFFSHPEWYSSPRSIKLGLGLRF